MTARRRIHRSALAAPCVGVTLLCALRLRGIALCACPRLRRSARGGGYLTLRRLAEIPNKRPCQTAQPCQLATISQKSRSQPAEDGTDDRLSNAWHGPSWTSTSQIRQPIYRICDRFQNCVTNEGGRMPFVTKSANVSQHGSARKRHKRETRPYRGKTASNMPLGRAGRLRTWRPCPEMRQK